LIVSKFVVAFLATYAGSLAAALLIDASYGVYYYQLIYFLNPPARWWGAHLPELRYSFTIAIVILAAYSIRYQQYAQNRLMAVPMTKWLLVFLLMIAVTSFWAVWPKKHNEFLVGHFKLMMFLCIAYKVIDTYRKYEVMIWTFLLGNFYVGWVSRQFGRTGAGRLEDTGPADTGGDGNATAAILVTAMPLLLFYLWKGKWWQRLMSVVCLAFVMDTLVLINSRGSFLALVLSLGYLLVKGVMLASETSRKDRVKIFAIVMAGAIFFFSLTDDIFWSRMATIITESEEEYGGGGRKYFWLKTFDLVATYPFGVGGWGYQYLSPEFIPEDFLVKGGGSGPGRRAVHSTYFQCLAEYGFLGAIVFAGILLSTFRFLKRTRMHVRRNGNLFAFYQAIALESSLIAYLTAAVFLSLLYPEILYWLILFAACMGNIHMLQDKQSTGGLDVR
jgi:probable O-glycosylation ligase (exosortase A-associated)